MLERLKRIIGRFNSENIHGVATGTYLFAIAIFAVISVSFTSYTSMASSISAILVLFLLYKGKKTLSFFIAIIEPIARQIAERIDDPSRCMVMITSNAANCLGDLPWTLDSLIKTSMESQQSAVWVVYVLTTAIMVSFYRKQNLYIFTKFKEMNPATNFKLFKGGYKAVKLWRVGAIASFGYAASGIILVGFVLCNSLAAEGVTEKFITYGLSALLICGAYVFVRSDRKKRTEIISLRKWPAEDIKSPTEDKEKWWDMPGPKRANSLTWAVMWAFVNMAWSLSAMAMIAYQS